MDSIGLTAPFLALYFEGEQNDLVHLLDSLLQNGSSESADVSESRSSKRKEVRGREQTAEDSLCFSMHIKTAILLR